jgi:hypothetical protein
MVIVPVRPDRLLPDVVAIGSFLRGSGPPVERRTAAIGLAHTNPPAGRDAPEPHVAAHRAVAIRENIASVFRRRRRQTTVMRRGHTSTESSAPDCAFGWHRAPCNRRSFADGVIQGRRSGSAELAVLRGHSLFRVGALPIGASETVPKGAVPVCESDCR